MRTFENKADVLRDLETARGTCSILDRALESRLTMNEGGVAE
jgi:hypothetical protein